MARASSSELMRGAAAQLIRAMEQKGIVWWIYDGYSIRRMHQTELLMEVEPDGRGCEDCEQEPQPEAGELRGGSAAMAAGHDDGDPVGGSDVAQDDESPSPTATQAERYKKLLREKLAPRARPRSRPRRRRRAR